MKKSFLPFVTFISFTLLSGSVNAQLDKGSWLVGGNLGFQSTKAANSFYLNPNVGLFVANKVATGLAFSYYNSGSTLLSVGPFMRGYIKMGKVTLFGHARFVYTNVSGAGVLDGDQFGFGGGPALGVFLNDYVALEGLFDYYIPDLGDGSGSSLGLNIGLQVYFPKD